MHRLLAYVKATPTKTGASFMWYGTWKYDPVSGTLHARDCARTVYSLVASSSKMETSAPLPPSEQPSPMSRFPIVRATATNGATDPGD